MQLSMNYKYENAIDIYYIFHQQSSIHIHGLARSCFNLEGKIHIYKTTTIYFLKFALGSEKIERKCINLDSYFK